MQVTQRRFGLSGFGLKWIAMVSMLIDHAGMALFPQYLFLRIIGRLAFPIYCFLLVEGAVHTSNKKQYLGRLFLFALLSEIPFDLLVSGRLLFLDAQNVFFTLFLGLLAVFALEKWRASGYGALASLLLVLAAWFARTDYGGGGVVIILLFYLFRQQKLLRTVSFGAATALLYGGLQNYAILSMGPVLCYNGKRGPRVKYFFYVFYPAHLLVLYFLKKIL